MVEAVKEYFSKYATFSGRTNKGTFWWTVLGLFLINLALILIGKLFGMMGNAGTTIMSIVRTIWSLGTIIPSLALAVRRLHDINKSGWFILMGLIPLAGPIILLVYYLKDSVNEGNNY